MPTTTGQFVYVLHGEDTFSRDEEVRKLKERMRTLPAGEHNLTELAADEAGIAAVRAAADALPFLADRRMVIVHGLLGRLQGRGGMRAGRRPRGKADTRDPAGDLQALLAYLPHLPDTTSVVFVEGAGVDPSPVETAVTRGRAFLREYPKVVDVARWIRARARAVGADFDESAVRELAALGGDDLRRLDGEIRKLAAFADGRTATRADVQELVVGRDTIIWTLLDALAERRRDRALAALRRLYEQGETPEALLGRDVAPLYRRLLLAKEVSLLDRRERAAVDVAALGLNPRALPKLAEQVARFDLAELDRALDLLLATDRLIKTGETEPATALEVLVIELCSRLGAAPDVHP
jgi:DNA polymerase-3 subunit delta